MGDFETHPRGTIEVLRQLREEREALMSQLKDQRGLLAAAKSDLQWLNQQSNTASMIDEHLKGTQ